MRHEDFAEQMRRSRADAEIPVADWFKRHGAKLLPVFRYNADGAPKLEAFSAAESEVLPDLLLARKGLLEFVEVKLKSRGSETRMRGGQKETGIGQRLFGEYMRVRKSSGARVYLAFVQEEEGVVTCDDIEVLDVHPDRRRYDGDKMDPGGMFFWPLSDLTTIATVEDVRCGRAPTRRAPVPLTAAELGAANDRRCREPSPPKGGFIVREPADNVYGRFKVLRRVDGLFVVHDPQQWPPDGPVFWTEADARLWAQRLTEDRRCGVCGDAIMPDEDERECFLCAHLYLEQREREAGAAR